MYQTHFGLRERPFRATPDSTCYYPATSHERALHRLLQGLRDDEGFVVLTGEPGTGKTLLCHCLLERLGSDGMSVLLTNTHFANRAALLQAILYDLSLPYEGRTEQEMRLALTDFLLRHYAEGRRTVLLADEAQHLTVEVLEELRLLANLESRQGRALQVVLVAQPALLHTLNRPTLASLAQRVAVRADLAPLDLQEAADYLLHQARAAGARPQTLFSEEALEVLARGSGGVPRLLNQAAHQALSLAAAAGASMVDAEAALEALTLLGLDEETEEAGAAGPITQALGETQADRGPMLALDGCGDDPGPCAEEAEKGDDQACRLFTAPRRLA
jgi:type II secretory pathway predicted ATPase ExeA